MAHEYIRIQGARTHNLKSIDVELPRDRLIVITGLSGSGKSSLAFDTIYAEGQRRYVESLSAYARQFLSMMEKPDMDHIEGLSPAISIEQKSTSHNPRSTVGTVTEIHDYLRLLFARAGTPHCPTHGVALHAQEVSQMVDQVLDLPEGTRLLLLAPLVDDRKGEHQHVLDELRTQGFVRARIDGAVVDLDEAPWPNTELAFRTPPVVDLTARDTGDRVVHVTGTLRAILEVECRRCLTAVPHRVDLGIDWLYDPGLEGEPEGERPDLVLLDLNLPGKSGHELLEELKEDEELRRIPVVILTSSEAEEDISKSYDRYANAYVTKPVDLEGISKVVRAIDGFWFEVVRLAEYR
jgi:CheY-like chemotaxis protein